MALTTQEEIIIKEIAAKESIEKQVQAVIDAANVQLAEKYDDIKAIETQRDLDIKAIRDAK